MQTKLSPEQIGEIRQRYANGELVDAIAASYGIARGTVYYWADGGPKKGAKHLPPLKRRGRGVAGSRPGVRGTRRRRDTIDRIWRMASQQVEDIELRLAKQGQEPPERERDARMLAVLVKTLRELAAFDRADRENSTKPKKDAPRDHDDAVPADIDELRRELARRVDLIRQRRAADGAHGGDAA